MGTLKRKHIGIVFFALALLLNSCTKPLPSHDVDLIRSGVVKIYSTFQEENYLMPWQSGRIARGTGTGFIISGKRILTNAHVVSNAKLIYVQKDDDPSRYVARVAFITHDNDIAMLTVEDENFFDGTVSLEMADTLPLLNDEVVVMGYPMGGDRISITRGIVSRIDYGIYAHSGLDSHLLLQVDAAINPGNSGGPILFGGRVIALAFQGLMMGDNIGYGIPFPVINRFLEDIADGHYDGYPELGVGFLSLENKALREELGLNNVQTGVAIDYVDPFGSACGHIKLGDVLLEIDGHRIYNDGSVLLDNNKILFAELLERKQWGDSISITVWRNSKAEEIKVPLTNPPDPFIYRNLYDQRPEYFIVGGLVFSPLTREYLNIAYRDHESQNLPQLTYYSEYAKLDGLYKDRDEFVVLIKRIPHSINTYAGEFVSGILMEVNGIKITELEDVKKAILSPVDGVHSFAFAGLDDELVLDAALIEEADEAIMANYDINSLECFNGKKK